MGKSTFSYDKNGLKIKVTSDIKKKFDKYQKMLFDPSGVFTKTMGDMQRRVPGKVADAVRNIYNIKKSDIIPSKRKTDLKKAGYISMTGQTVADLKLHYEGRVLTPLHFKYSPQQLPDNKKYKMKFKIRKIASLKEKKDKTVKIPFLAPARKSSLRIIPWIRMPEKNNEILPMKTVSLPQMVDDEKARKIMNASIGDLLETRFNHHMQRYLKEAVN